MTRAFLGISVVSLFLVAGCGPAVRKPPSASPSRSDKAAGGGSGGGSEPRIEGTLERTPAERARAKRIKIFGQLHRIMKNEHGKLPPVEAVSRGGVGDPVINIINDTNFDLTIWFAGQCAHKTRVPAATQKTEVFCPGTYNVAAVVDNKEYLPLVRENQKFMGGVGYNLKIIVKLRPKTTPAK